MRSFFAAALKGKCFLKSGVHCKGLDNFRGRLRSWFCELAGIIGQNSASVKQNFTYKTVISWEIEKGLKKD